MALISPEGLGQLLAVHLRQQLGALLAVPVLAGERAAVGDHQLRRLVEELAPVAQTLGRPQVEVDPAVDAAVPEVPVERRAVVVALQQLLEVPQVVAQPIGRHRRVLPARPVVALARDVCRRPQAGLPHLPDLLLLILVVEELHRGRIGVLPQALHAVAGALIGLLDRVSPELDQEPAGPPGKERDLGLVHALGVHVVDQPLVDPLKPHRAVLEDLGNVVGGVEDVLVAEHQQGAAGRAVHQADGRLEHRGQGALGTDQGTSDVEAVLGQQLVEVVAGDPTRNVREALADLIRVAVAQVPHAPVDLAFAPTGSDDPLELLLRRRPHGHPHAVVGDDLELLDVVGGAPRHHRVDPAGVVADHAAEGGVLVGRGVRGEGEVEPVLREVRELIADHPRLDPRHPAIGVDLDDPAQALGDVDHHRPVGRLARETGGAAARQDRGAMVVARRDGGDDVLGGLRHDHPERVLTVVGAVVRVDRAGSGVEAHLAANGLPQVALQRPDVHLLGLLRAELAVAEPARVSALAPGGDLRVDPPVPDRGVDPARALGREAHRHSARKRPTSGRSSRPRPALRPSGCRHPPSGFRVPSKSSDSIRT